MQMSTAAAGFVEAHQAALERVLRDAGVPGGAGSGAWQPGEADLEAAALVLQLLQWLVPHHKQHRTGAVQDLWSNAFVYVPLPRLKCARSWTLTSACLSNCKQPLGHLVRQRSIHTSPQFLMS